LELLIELSVGGTESVGRPILWPKLRWQLGVALEVGDSGD